MVDAVAPLLIRDQAGLSRLIGYKGRVRLDLPGLSPPEAVLAEARLNRALLACGCTEGAVGLILSLGPGLWLLGQGHWLWALGAVVMGALLGKGAGLLRGRRAVLREIRGLSAFRSGS